jgi:RimJ/RimL family protein N-acetyltransferase
LLLNARIEAIAEDYLSTIATIAVAVRDQGPRLSGSNYSSIAPSTRQKDSAIEICQALPTDGPALNALLNQLDWETPYLGYKPGERSPQEWRIQREIIEDTSGRSGAIFLARRDTELVGFLQAQTCPLRLLRHVLTIEIGICQRLTGRGIGNRLFETVETWARTRQVHRLELTVASENERALRLYEKCGFAIEGTRRHAMLIDGEYVDEHFMAKLLT